MKWLGSIGVGLVAVAAACGGDPASGSGGNGGSSGGSEPLGPCEKSRAHLEECAPAADLSSASGGTVECVGVIACQANCTSAASCKAILGLLPDLKDYVECLDSCQ